MLNLILTRMPSPRLCSLEMPARAWSSSIWAALPEDGEKEQGEKEVLSEKTKDAEEVQSFILAL